MPMAEGGRKARMSPQSARYKAWQSMRILRRFTVPDIIRTSGISRDNLHGYLPWLVKMGYVAEEIWKGKTGQAGSYKAYRLVKDVPEAPTTPKKRPGVSRDTD